VASTIRQTLERGAAWVALLAAGLLVTAVAYLEDAELAARFGAEHAFYGRVCTCMYGGQGGSLAPPLCERRRLSLNSLSLSLSLSRTGGRTEACCLLTHVEASVSLTQGPGRTPGASLYTRRDSCFRCAGES